MQQKQMLDDSYKQAREVMRNTAFFDTRKWTDQKTRAERKNAHPLILVFEKKFISHCQNIGIPMFAHSVIRTKQEQEQLYIDGHSQVRGGSSPHQYGAAVDLVHSTYAWNLPSKKCWDLLGQIGKEVAHSASIPIEWGGDWSFYDPAHWQLDLS